MGNTPISTYRRSTTFPLAHVLIRAGSRTQCLSERRTRDDISGESPPVEDDFSSSYLPVVVFFLVAGCRVGYKNVFYFVTTHHCTLRLDGDGRVDAEEGPINILSRAWKRAIENEANTGVLAKRGGSR